MRNNFFFNDALQKAICLDESGLYIQALDLCYEMLCYSPNDYFALMLRATIEDHAGHHEEAIKHLDEFLELFPDDLMALLRRAILKDLNGDYDGALADYNACAEHEPLYGHVFVGRGELLLMRGEKEQARHDFEKALELEKARDESVVTPFAYFFLGEREKAVESMIKNLNETNKSSCYDAACLYALLDDEEKALFFWEKALEQGYCFFCHARKDRNLKRLQGTKTFQELLERYENKRDNREKT